MSYSASKPLRSFFFRPGIIPAVLAWLLFVLTSQGALVHRWSFSEASGTNLIDSVGTANGWIVVNGVTDYTRGAGFVRLAGGARANADYIQFSAGLVHSLTNVTIEVWATPNAAQNWSRVFDFGPGNDTQANDWFLSFCQGTTINQQRLEYGAGVTGSWTLDTALATTLSNEFQYVTTWSATGGPSGGGLAQWFRNGALVGAIDTGDARITNVNDTVLWLGRSQYPGDSTASADYDEVRIYSHALGTNEINFSLANGPTNYVAPPGQASGFAAAANVNPVVLSWTPGAGSAGSVVVMSAGTATSAQPNYGTNYLASANFGSGQNLGGSNFVVFAGAGGSVTVSNLIPGTQYFATVYSYSGSGAATVFNLADAPSVNFTAIAVVQSLTLQTTSPLLMGAVAQAAVQANFVGGASGDVTALATYSSSAPSVVSVSTNGILTALAAGTATITATFQMKQNSNVVTVINPLLSNLRHRYPFTTDASDVAGNANGTMQGGASIVNNQLLLDGVSGYVSFPTGIIANHTNITMEAWVSNTVSATWSRIFDFGTGTTVNFFLTPISGGGAIRCSITTGGAAAEQQMNGTAAMPLNSLQHVVVTINGSIGTLYLNGVAVGVNNALTLNPAGLGSTTQNYLGKSQYADPYFSGAMEEFRIYDAALPAGLVMSNYLAGPNALPIAPPVTVNDAITLNPGAEALIPVLANDTGSVPNSATVQVVAPPFNGTAVANTNGKILYTHNGSATSSDAFTYRVQNFSGSTSAVATVFITITNTLRLPNSTITIPSTPPALGYQVVDAFPGVTFSQPLALQSLPGGTVYSNALFVVERRGYVSYIQDATVTNPVRQVFLDISNQVSYDNSATDGERGLLGLAFHPGFATNGFFFVAYIADGGNPYFVKLARFTANPANLTVNTNTQVVLWSTTKREFNHNGSDLHFGLEGYLYISTGDEGAQYNFHTNAQRLDASLYSGLLRLDVDKRPGNLEPLPPAATVPTLTIPTDTNGHAFYSIPADNPFLGVTNLYGVTVDRNHLRGEFYAIGFRHIWRFSIDPFTGEIWAGNVGQDLYESVDLVRKGGNYGWPYYEGTYLTSVSYPTQPTMFPPPAGFVLDQPIFEYNHPAVPGTDPAFSGLDVCGSVPYHGAKIPQLTNANIFGDFDLGGNIWALSRTNGAVTVQLLMSQYGESAFGTDPSNGDVLLCNYIQNKIQRLVYTDVTNSAFPAKLSDTGIFADLTTLTPNPGIVSYSPIISFWSDYAIKQRWFCIPDTTNQMIFGADTNWAFPSGMMWIKHFDLELTRGDPSTKKRIETRVLVKTTNACYGVSYQWNDAGTEAYLAPNGGTNFIVNVLVNSTNLVQQWEIPSRSSCLACHVAVAGHALSFNTRELNQTTNMNGFAGNQLTLLGQYGYLNTNITAPQTLPAFATATDSTSSLEFRVRSYLAQNCVQCHQPGGSGAQTWDARPWLTLDQTHLINGAVNNNAGNPLNLLIVPGDTNHSALLQHLIGTTFSRMPPLATHQLDQGSINLLTTWITTDLTNRQSFAQWQLAWFGSTNAANALATADPDGDGANNYYEYLTGTSPLTNDPPPWTIGISLENTNLDVNFLRLANRAFVVESSTNLSNWSTWNVPGNLLYFGETNQAVSVSGTWLPTDPPQFFRVKIIEP